MKYIALISTLAIAAQSYDLATQISAGQKAQYCLTNQQQCSNYCDSKTQINTCNSDSLIWNCICSSTGKIPTVVPLQQFIIEVKQCDGAVQECITACLASNPSNTDCSAQCKKGLCGTTQALQSKSFLTTPPAPQPAAEEPSSASTVVMSLVSSISALLFALL